MQICGAVSFNVAFLQNSIKKYVNCCKHIRLQKMLLLEWLVFVAPRKFSLVRQIAEKRD